MSARENPAVVLAANLKRAQQIGTIWAIPRVLTVVVVVIVSWGQKCDRPLHIWLIVLASQDTMRFPLRLNILREVRRLEREHNVRSREFQEGLSSLIASKTFTIGRWCSHLVLGWYGCGIVWLFSSSDCQAKAPSVYRLTLALIIILFTFLGFNVICGLLYFILVVIYRLWGVSLGERPNAVGVDVSDGATEKSITKLPIVKFKEGKSANDLCSICLCDYEEGEELRQLPCNHDFHFHCVGDWLKLSLRCPLCNQRLLPNMQGIAVEYGRA
jgi:hypothetical protein